MPDILPNLLLPILMPSQAQKHVTHNEALQILDTLVQLSVLSDSTDTPPAAPDEGARYLLPANAQGDWSGQDGAVAGWGQGAWAFHAPQPGWRCYVADRNALLLFDGTGWREIGGELLENLAGVGIGTDTSVAPFSAKLNQAFWTALYAADGGDGNIHQTLNKESNADNAGLILQTDFITRAIIGLFGSDSLRFSVSQDGLNFNDGMILDGATGIVEQPSLPRFSGRTNFDNFGDAGTWVKIAINDLSYNAQGAFDAVTNLFTAPVDGIYHFGGHLLFKVDINDKARLTARIVKNGTDQLPGTYGRITSNHDSGQTFLDTQAFVPLVAGDTIELQGMFAGYSGYFHADETTFWGYKVG